MSIEKALHIGLPTTNIGFSSSNLLHASAHCSSMLRSQPVVRSNAHPLPRPNCSAFEVNLSLHKNSDTKYLAGSSPMYASKPPASCSAGELEDEELDKVSVMRTESSASISGGLLCFQLIISASRLTSGIPICSCSFLSCIFSVAASPSISAFPGSLLLFC